MSEAIWLQAIEPASLLEAIPWRIAQRKTRLFCCACCRVVWHSFTSKAQDAIWWAEMYAEGYTDRYGLEVAMEQARSLIPNRKNIPLDATDAILASVNDSPYPGMVTEAMASEVAQRSTPASQMIYEKAWAAERKHQCHLLRDIFGNPFRPVALDPAWQTVNVVALAQAMYDERAFDRMPILGDALEDAGCTNANVLTHCRQPGEHVRGCWVVDLLLGKK